MKNVKKGRGEGRELGWVVGGGGNKRDRELEE